uniref:Alpha-2,8-sialyltransferase 8F-like n=1 Tax=Saccoglossus kowalevskii TaxID=10224 RepID=A0ABM0MZ67_SACKO|nr:PREDICTED: alpha-2,8-sialyltransferase 8F-like [Saccoglossus kowalevskii]
MHPEHFAKTGKFWNSRGMEQRMTTGFYLTSLAIELCDQVLLYGFWPFTATADGKPVNYHYFDQMDLSTSTAHNFSTEFEVLLQLHEEGIIHLNIDKCD